MLEPFDGSCFHGLSSPQPHPVTLWGVALRFARSLTESKRPGLAEAVAAEGYRRVLQRDPPRLKANPYDLSRRSGRLPEHGFLDTYLLGAHSTEIDRLLDWNKCRKDLFTRRGRWVTYADDPEFTAWVSSMFWKHREGYEHRFLPNKPLKIGFRPLLSLAELVPMPEPLLFAHFKKSLWQPRTPAEGRLPTVPSHLVALTCQRLLAYHCMQHARFGRWHVIRLLRLLHGRKWRVNLPDVGEALFSEFMRGPLWVGATHPGPVVTDWVPRIQRVLADVTRTLSEPDTACAAVKQLLPNRLRVFNACGRCKTPEGKLIQPLERALPPFAFNCRCSQLAWSSTRMVELERILRIWAIDVALGPSPATLFPVLELFERSHELRWSRCASPPGPLLYA